MAIPLPPIHQLPELGTFFELSWSPLYARSLIVKSIYYNESISQAELEQRASLFHLTKLICSIIILNFRHSH